MTFSFLNGYTALIMLPLYLFQRSVEGLNIVRDAKVMANNLHSAQGCPRVLLMCPNPFTAKLITMP